MKFWPLIKVLPVKTNFHFVRLSKAAGILSMLLVIGSLAISIFPFTPPCGGLTCGIDFKGGTVLDPFGGTGTTAVARVSWGWTRVISLAMLFQSREGGNTPCSSPAAIGALIF